MAREVELKLEIDPAHVGKLKSHPLFRRKPHRAQQTSVYFDTPKGKLRKSGWVLRVRHEGDRWIQTIKHSGDNAGLFDRGEWEADVTGSQPNLEAIAGTPLNALIKARQFRDLVPLVRTEVTRSTWIASANSATIEITYDEGSIEAGGASEPIHEVELELKAGRAPVLFSTAKRISANIPVKLGVLAKSERGFALAEGRQGKPVKATHVDLNEKATVAEGFAVIVTACLKHFRINEALLISHGDSEALHQLRVAVRRIRSALWLFRPVVKDDEFIRASDRLRRFTRELGAARNIDVILATMREGDPARDHLERDRRLLYARILRKLDSRAFRAFVLDLLAWTHTGEWRNGKKAGKRLIPFAVRRLDKLWDKIDERGADLSRLTVGERHRLRIDTKKIRYALQFLEEPFRRAGRAQEEFAAAAEGVQDSLGCLNDLATRQALLGTTPQPWLIEMDATRYLRAAKGYLRKLRKIRPYWRKASR
ncbi:CHAD domain-containing protein [Sphingomonas sp. G124]|uniref:CHAD domain-containing protein n=1 Tax=Sphingomonas cremea TaxID=2904799 RepID=A0A9X1TXH1_9SPHN|nr:CYTH and CHAD domain-containing protein [Sphingomonas cremea]MCF2515170.1 CHAD domain-containing protein [Sphingomonas cremea]